VGQRGERRDDTAGEVCSYLDGSGGSAARHLFLPISVHTPLVLRPYVFRDPMSVLAPMGTGDIDDLFVCVTNQMDGPDRLGWIRLLQVYARVVCENDILHKTLRSVDGEDVEQVCGLEARFTGGISRTRDDFFVSVLARVQTKTGICGPRRRAEGELERHMRELHCVVPGCGAFLMNDAISYSEVLIELAKREGMPERLAKTNDTGWTTPESCEAWTGLWPVQKDIVEMAMNCPTLLLDGKAGTGKTHTLAVLACRLLCTPGNTVCFCCQTKQGCDAFLEKVSKLSTHFPNMATRQPTCKTFAYLETHHRYNPDSFACSMEESSTVGNTMMIMDEWGKLNPEQQTAAFRH
jgi:hypothetical protein